MADEKITLRNKINKFAYGKLLHILGRKKALCFAYKRQEKKKLNLEQPERFMEKLFWLIRYNEIYCKDLIQRTYDKNTVREYIAEKGLEKILIPQIECYADVNDIDFDSLPQRFILKMTQSSGQNVVCMDKKNFDKEGAKKNFEKWMKQKKKKDYLMGYYFTDNEKIVCEELLLDENGRIPNDLKIFCCNGEPKFFYFDIDSTDEDGRKKHAYYREFFDTDWNYLPVDCVNRVRKNLENPITAKPKNLTEILETARKLSEDFIFVRVDLYLLDNKIYFGELTPIPGIAGGFRPDEWDYKFGEMLKLPGVKIF